jgi:hypothetical protein
MSRSQSPRHKMHCGARRAIRCKLPDINYDLGAAAEIVFHFVLKQAGPMYFISGSAAFARCRHSKISIVEEPSEPVTLVHGRGSLRLCEGVWGRHARPRFDRGDPVVSETASVPRNRGFSRQVRLWARCSIPRFGGIDARAGACEFWRENGCGHVAAGAPFSAPAREARGRSGCVANIRGMFTPSGRPLRSCAQPGSGAGV